MLLMLLLAASGSYMRITSCEAPVHVAIPPRPASVTVVYVHGLWNTVDEAWVQHRLPEQVEASGLDAVLVAPEAPSQPGQPVMFPELAALIRCVEQATGVQLPETVIAIGHSGAYQTLKLWVDEPRVRSLVLLDAFYGSAAPWERFLARGGALHIVSGVTARRAAAFCAGHDVCERSRLSHMAIVTSGDVIPRVLREAAAAVIPEA
jgi:pimeloyl-ACP methyl ester carboxylesterase